MKRNSGIFIFFFGLTICFGFSSQYNFLKDEDTAPPELGKEPTTILLLETPRKKVNKDMMEAFEKNYSGTVEMIDEAMLTSGQYKDKKKYRYYLRTDIKFVPANRIGSNPQPATYDYSYGLTDRQTDLHYGTSNASDAWLSLLKRYIRKLEEVWKSNQKQ